MRTMSAALLALLAGLALVVAGCGGSDERDESTTPGQAIVEIGKVRALLDSALARYRAGDEQRADDIVGDAYLEHFEHVEGPLGDADDDLKENLEETIATELRDKIKAGAPVNEVADLVGHTKEHLDEAEGLLAKA